MTFRMILASSFLLLAGISSAATLQYPLQPDDSSLSSDDLAYKKLADALGKRLFPVEPIGKPCYEKKSPIPNQCIYNTFTRTNDTWTSDQPGGYFYGNFPACQANGTTCILPVTNTTIPDHATCHQGSVPKLMIEVDHPDTLVSDIQLAINYSLETGTPLVVKNTGHDWKGRSSGRGSLALWTHNLRSPNVPILIEEQFTPAGCQNLNTKDTVFHFGAGEQWGAAYDFAAENGLAVVGGTCGTVGIAGWLHGGGHSPMTPVYGMGVDNVRQLEVYVPSLNKVVIANECQNEDLYFAIRGGGGGTWGVVTKITYKAIEPHHVQDLHFANLTLNETDTRTYLELLTSSMTTWTQRGWGGYIKSSVNGHGVELSNPEIDNKQAQDDMQSLIDFVTARGKNATIVDRTSWHDYIKNVMRPADVHVGLWGGNSASRLLQKNLFTREKLKTLDDAIWELYKSELYFWIMLVAPTKFPHTNTSSLHPAWGEAVAAIRASNKWDQFIDKPEDYGMHYAKTHNGFDSIRKITGGGVSISEADIWEENYEEVFWGRDNYEKLLRIKKEVDPKNLFTNWQAVNFNDTDPRFECYPRLGVKTG